MNGQPIMADDMIML